MPKRKANADAANIDGPNPIKKPKSKKPTPPNPPRPPSNLGLFTTTPQEIINLIASHITYLPDIFSFLNTCRTFQTILGTTNKLFWYNYITQRTSLATNRLEQQKNADKYKKFDKKFNYLAVVKKACGIKRKLKGYCNVCFGNVEVFATVLFGKMRVCERCAKENLVAIKDLIQIPNLDLTTLPHTKLDTFPHLPRTSTVTPIDSHILYTWLPTVSRRLAKLHPSQSYHQILNSTSLPRSTFLSKTYNENYSLCPLQDRITRKTMTILRPWLVLYADVQNVAISTSTTASEAQKKWIKKNGVDASIAEKENKIWPTVYWMADMYARIDYKRIRQFGVEVEDVKEEDVERSAKIIAYEILRSKRMKL